VNAFALNYEYLTADRDLRALVDRLNVAFDLVVVPALFLRAVLRDAGLRVPVVWVPWGFDPHEFRPDAKPVAIPVGSRFVFLHASAANERKGTDVLLDAFRAEFTGDDTVALVVKEAPRQATWARWSERVERLARRPGPPLIRWLRQPVRSLAGHFTRADVGVFPHRGEGFGLPVLECIASGRRVITTDGTGPSSFASRANSWLIRATPVERRGRLELAPDPSHLRALLREAYNRGRATRREARAVADSVAGWTWGHTVDRLEAALDDALRTPARRTRQSRSARIAQRRPNVAYAFMGGGTAGWKKISSNVDIGLRGRFDSYRAFTARDAPPSSTFDVIVGLSEHSLDAILAVRRRNPGAIVIVHQESTVLGDRVAIVNHEREQCGLPLVRTSPLAYWRNRKENELADAFIVLSRVARRHFVANGFDPASVHVVPCAADLGPLHARTRARTTRFLFVGTEPFRKGIRDLFTAWEHAGLRNAELICHVDLEVLRSKLLLGYLVRNPDITVLPLLPQRAFRERYRDVDCQVLPSLEDTFSLTIADGMGVGKPAIVSDATGVADLITHGVDGHIVPAGDPEALSDALRQFAADRQRLLAMGAAAHETISAYPWQRFRSSVADLVQRVWDCRVGHLSTGRAAGDRPRSFAR